MLLPYFFRYAKLIISEAMNDKQRYLDNELQIAQKEWRMYQIESRFGQDWCKENMKSRSDVIWLTIVVDENFAVPALVLAHSIRTFSCQKNMIALISDTATEGTQRALQIFRALVGKLVLLKQWTVTGSMPKWAVNETLDCLEDHVVTELREHTLDSTPGTTLNFPKSYMLMLITC